jgi:hypothetical protein
MKGQFFIVGALIIVILLFIGLPIIRPLLLNPSEDMKLLADNVEKELPYALNLGLKTNTPVSSLLNFTRFVDRVLTERDVTFSSLWIISQNSTGGVNITIGNFLPSNTTVTLGLTTVFVPTNSTNSTELSASEKFNLTISFEGRQKTVEWLRKKTNLYAYLEFQRGENIIKEELVA